MVAQAEDDRRRAVTEAEAAAVEVIAQVRKQLQDDFERALKKAGLDAEEMFQQQLKKAQEEAARVKEISRERLQKAIELVLRVVKERWQ